VTAIEAAGLDDELSTGGPFTLFAPTNAAFDALPEGVLDAVLADVDLLTDILLYHVASGTTLSTDLSTASPSRPVDGRHAHRLDLGQHRRDQRCDGDAGRPRRVERRDPRDRRGTGPGRQLNALTPSCNAETTTMRIAMILGALALVAAPAAAQYSPSGTKAKPAASTPATMNIVEVAASAGMFNTLLTAAKAAGLAETLASGGPFTVFAPTDEAFAALPRHGGRPAQGHGEAEGDPAVPRGVRHGDGEGRGGLTKATTLQGGDLKINTSNGVMINDAMVVKADVAASNGVIHVINKVLLP